MTAHSSNKNIRVVLIAALAGVLFGFDTAVISGITQNLRDIYALTPAGLGAAVSSALWGTLLGALTVGYPGDRYGARNALRVVGLLYVIGAVGCASNWNIESFVAFRFLVGIAVGASSVLAPVYIAEVAPAQTRGALTGLFQFNIVFGILLAYLSNFIVAASFAGPSVWRWKLAIATIPALVFVVLLFTIPQSARWLFIKGRKDAAIDSLHRVGVAEPAAMLAEFARNAESTEVTSTGLSWQRHRRPIVLALLLAMFNQLSGINAILYYLGDIFAAAGFTSVSSSAQQVVIGIANLLATCAALLMIDRIGRRTLLLIGSVGTAAALMGVAVIMSRGTGQAYLLWLLVGFIVAFAFSQGAVIWVYLSEIFPTSVRARGQSLGSATHWVMNALIAMLFPVVAAYTRALPFWFFAACMLMQLLVVWLWFPETKGVALEDMHRLTDAHSNAT
jgi:sugar porter (SP) family MFS transporter